MEPFQLEELWMPRQKKMTFLDEIARNGHSATQGGQF